VKKKVTEVTKAEVNITKKDKNIKKKSIETIPEKTPLEDSKEAKILETKVLTEVEPKIPEKQHENKKKHRKDKTLQTQAEVNSIELQQEKEQVADVRTEEIEQKKSEIQKVKKREKVKSKTISEVKSEEKKTTIHQRLQKLLQRSKRKLKKNK